MNLTLRTLLAYLDDMLPPEETRQIGQKVAESDSVRELVARIRKVTRRRRLTTPDVEAGVAQPVDPNTVAEYLDNVLSKEEVAELERLCLESDVHLAEVASCHQILTVVLGQPAQVPPTARQRMYGIVSGPEAIPGRRPRTLRRAADPADETEVTEVADDRLLLGFPRFRWSGTWGQRLVPIAAALLLLAGLVAVLALALPDGERGRRPVVARGPGLMPTAPLPGAEPDGARPLAAGKPAGAESPAGADTTRVALGLDHAPARLVGAWAGLIAARPVSAAAVVPWGEPEIAAAPAGRPAEGPADKPADRPADKPVEKPADKPAGKPAAPAAPEQPAPAAPAAIRPPSAVRAVTGTHTPANARESLLVRRTGDELALIRPQGKVETGDLLIAMPGFQGEVTLANKIRLDLVGCVPGGSVPNFSFESAATLHAADDVDLDLTLDRGRLLVANRAAGPSSARLRFLDQVWAVRLRNPQTEIALEMVGRVPPGSGPFEPRVRVAMLVVAGEAELTRGGKTDLLTAGKLALWDNVENSASVEVITPKAESVAWTKKLGYSDEIKAALAAFQKRLLDKPAQDGSWMKIAFDEALTAPKPWEAYLGLFSLGAIDHLAPVVRTLEDPERPDLRRAALDTILNWVGRQSRADERLRPVLSQRLYGDEDVGLLLQLFRGFEQPNRPTLEMLVLLLGHERLPVRELAYIHLNLLQPGEHLTGYDPAGPPDQRGKAVEAIRARVLRK